MTASLRIAKTNYIGSWMLINETTGIVILSAEKPDFNNPDTFSTSVFSLNLSGGKLTLEGDDDFRMVFIGKI